MCPTATCLILPKPMRWQLAMRLKNHTEYGVYQFSTRNFLEPKFSHTRKFEHSVLRLTPLLHQNWLQERLPVLCWLCKPEYLPPPKNKGSPSLAHPWGPKHTSSTSSKTHAKATSTCCNASQTSTICKPHGFCYCFAPAHGATISSEPLLQP